MASVKAFNAIMERLIEKTRASNPGVDIYKRKAKPRKVRKAKRLPKRTGWLN